MVKFLRSQYKNENVINAANKFINSTETAKNISKEFSIHISTLFRNVKNLRENNQKGGEKVIKSNTNIPKVKNNNKNQLPEIVLINNSNIDFKSEFNDENNNDENKASFINDNIKNDYVIKHDIDKYEKIKLSLEEYNQYLAQNINLLTYKEYKIDKKNRKKEKNELIKSYLAKNKNKVLNI